MRQFALLPKLDRFDKVVATLLDIAQFVEPGLNGGSREVTS
jgi:hypothetical protein